MKKPVKVTTITGFVLFALAATFSIALLLVLGDFAGQNPATTTALYRLGKMLASVYGVCSAFIPLFLIIAAIQCFTETWTVKRGVLLVGSVLPFFTLDAVEHVIRMMAANNEGAVLAIKLIGALLTSALILVAEYLILSLIGDLIENALEKSVDEDAEDGLDADALELDDVTDAADAPPAAEAETEPVPASAAKAVEAAEAAPVAASAPSAQPAPASAPVAVSAPATNNVAINITVAPAAAEAVPAVTATAAAPESPAEAPAAIEAADASNEDGALSTEAFLASAADATTDSDNPFAHIFDSDGDSGYLTSDSLAALEKPVTPDATLADSNGAESAADADDAPATSETASSFVETLLAAQVATYAAPDEPLPERITDEELAAVAENDATIADDVADADDASDAIAADASDDSASADEAEADDGTSDAIAADASDDSASVEDASASADEAEADAPYEPAPLVQPRIHEAPRYNEVATELVPEDEEPSELMELDTFDPDTDSFDGYEPHVEEIGEAEALDDDIAAFEQQNADDFDDSFYDIDLNAESDDELEDALADFDEADADIADEDFEEPAPSQPTTAGGVADASAQAEEIAVEEQKSTNLNDIFAEMDDDAAREPVLHDDGTEDADVSDGVIASGANVAAATALAADSGDAGTVAAVSAATANALDAADEALTAAASTDAATEASAPVADDAISASDSATLADAAIISDDGADVADGSFVADDGMTLADADGAFDATIADEAAAESDAIDSDDDAAPFDASDEAFAEPDLDNIEVTENEEPIFAEETAIDESELEETVSGEIDDNAEPAFTDVSADEFEDSADDAPVVDPLEPPVVDSDGIPYETSVPIDLDEIDFAEIGSEPVAVAMNDDESAALPAAAATATDATDSDEGAGAAQSQSEPQNAPQQKAAPRTQSATFTVTAAAPAPAVEHNDALVSEPPRRKDYGVYRIPTEGVLDTYANSDYATIDDETKRAGDDLKATLAEFKIEAEVTGIRKGPVVTMFELLPAPGVKLSKIVALQDNIALRLAASSVRIVAPIPGKHAVGIEVPNKERAIVSFKEIIEQDLPQFKKMAIPVVLGKDISGEAQMIDLAKTPHLLIAGSTGAGKSVCVNTMILSILYKRSPQEVKLIMIDPKVVELKLYNDIPHLLTPVITEPKRAFQSLQYCLCEMERRYALLDGMGVRDIVSYNNRIVERHIATEKLPYIVVIIDEFADLMATTGKELESTLARLAAMSRAVGIHLVLATQRPSIDVITGLIKANIPSRIAFMVASKMDSRIIIDQVGAEKLLGKGDMLYASATDPFPVRIQGTLVNDNEVERVVNCVKEYGEPDYIDDEIFVDDDDDGGSGASLFNEGEDPLYDEALEIVLQAGKASASYIQRRLKIGYNRAARLVEEMEERGIVGPANGSKPREVIHMPS